MSEVENYEIVNQKKDVVITYSLVDCKKLEDLETVNIVAKEQKNGYYDLHVSDINGNELVTLKNMEANSFNKLSGKRVLLAGISEVSNDILEVAVVNNIDIKSVNKLKFGSI